MSNGTDDIELTTSVAADRLRFGDRPQTDVRFHGSRGRRTYSGAERENLPEPVEPGTDYEDVRVDYRLATGLRTDAAREDGGTG
ncbi:hypothetical protein [Streptomyces nanshensis]|uniref:Uncharacterized protein n=1 Tax=Streptomyces nanshensis TaxID=518642 RepID=A0A1E7L911_9ACTN|nr:hypothetical protein [Streptomyces nanshensis]OEV12686.1 hypothetical protein AN218_07090 [Streptomyces nanshensis]